MSEEHLAGPGRALVSQHRALLSPGQGHAESSPGRDSWPLQEGQNPRDSWSRTAKIITGAAVGDFQSWLFVVWGLLRDSRALWGSSGINENLWKLPKCFKWIKLGCTTTPLSLGSSGDKGWPEWKTPSSENVLTSFPELSLSPFHLLLTDAK